MFLFEMNQSNCCIFSLKGTGKMFYDLSHLFLVKRLSPASELERDCFSGTNYFLTDTF